MNKTYVISDLNLFNEEQMKKCGYSNFEIMNNDIIKIWNRTVKEDDDVVLLGKVGDGDLQQMKSIISKLNGDLTILRKDINEDFTRDEWRQIGIRFFWNVPMFKDFEDGKSILCLYEKLTEKDLDFYRNQYNLLIVDSNNPIEGELPFDGIMMTADAARWGYSPLDLDEVLNIYDNMKQFAKMEDTEYRNEIKEFGEE